VRLRRLALGVVLVVAGSLAPADAAKAPGAQVGFWTGQNFTPCAGADPTACPRDLSAFTPEVWQALRAGRGALYFNLIHTVDFGPGATRDDAPAVLRKANALGVTVKAWLTVPVAHGTFANENNAAMHDAAVKAFYAWRNAHGLRIDEAVLDLELPAGYQALVDATDPTRLMSYRGSPDPAHQCAAVRSYARTISWAHRHKLVLSGAPMPFMLDDLDDGDLALADLGDFAPLFPGGYDHMYLQAYRTYSNTGPEYASGYLRRVRQYFGRAGEVTLGDTTMGPPYQSVDGLVHDVRMLVALGATAIPVFELASTVQKGGAAGVRAVLDAARHPMSAAEVSAATGSESPMTTATLGFFTALNTAASASHPSANAYPDGCPVKVEPLR
jgi:hypothetical protein